MGLIEIILLPNVFQSIKARLVYMLPYLLTWLIIPLIYMPSIFSGDSLNPLISPESKIEILPHWAPDRITRLEYLCTQIEIIWKIYLKLIIWPWNQSFDHPYTLRTGLIDGPVFIFVGLTILIFLMARIFFNDFLF